MKKSAIANLVLLGITAYACDLPQCRVESNCVKPIQTEDSSKFTTVCMNAGTEARNTGYYELNPGAVPGVYTCSCCGNVLFSAEALYHSGTGWPSFTSVANENSVDLSVDNSCFYCGSRVEVSCKKCGSHIGTI